MPGRRATREGDPGHELRPEGRDGRRVEVRGDEHRRPPVRMPQVGAHVARQDRRHAPTDVPDVRRSFAEVVVVDRGEHVGLLRGRLQDRLIGRRAGRDERERRIDDAGIAGEQRLGLEDRADLLAGSRRRLDRQRFELGRAAVEGVGQATVLGSGR